MDKNGDDIQGLDGIVERMAQLAPWHLDVEVRPGIWTSMGNRGRYDEPDFQNVSLVKPQELTSLLKKIYPKGLQGKHFLDVGCNNGGYCFLAKELGATSTFGFDVREHWIQQARLLKGYLRPNDDTMHFEVAALSAVKLDSYDLTLFKGVFYHLPDPIDGLARLCDATREVLILDTATKSDIPEDCLAAGVESTSHVMSGVDHLHWLPGGAQVLERIFHWKGFGTTRTVFHRCHNEKAKRGRLRMVAARDKSLMRHWS